MLIHGLLYIYSYNRQRFLTFCRQINQPLPFPLRCMALVWRRKTPKSSHSTSRNKEKRQVANEINDIQTNSRGDFEKPTAKFPPHMTPIFLHISPLPELLPQFINMTIPHSAVAVLSMLFFWEQSAWTTSAAKIVDPPGLLCSGCLLL
jgi:hypothetical protein